VIGCGINYQRKEIFFTKNGVFLGVTSFFGYSNHHSLVDQDAYPTVGLASSSSLESWSSDLTAHINLGAEKFVFDFNVTIVSCNPIEPEFPTPQQEEDAPASITQLGIYSRLVGNQIVSVEPEKPWAFTFDVPSKKLSRVSYHNANPIHNTILQTAVVATSIVVIASSDVEDDAAFTDLKGPFSFLWIHILDTKSWTWSSHKVDLSAFSPFIFFSMTTIPVVDSRLYFLHVVGHPFYIDISSSPIKAYQIVNPRKSQSILS